MQKNILLILFIAGNTPHLCSSGHVPAILVLAPSLINIIYCTSWEMQQTPQVIMRLEWKRKILSKLEIFFKIYMLPFSLFPMPIGVVVVVVQPCGSEETTHSPADSNAHLHWAPLRFPLALSFQLLLSWCAPQLKSNTQCWQNWKGRLCFSIHTLSSKLSFLIQSSCWWSWQFKNMPCILSYLTHLCFKQYTEEILVR